MKGFSAARIKELTGFDVYVAQVYSLGDTDFTIARVTSGPKEGHVVVTTCHTDTVHSFPAMPINQVTVLLGIGYFAKLAEPEQLTIPV